MNTKFIKKLILFILIIGMLLCLTACGDDNDNEKEDSKNETSYTGKSSAEALIKDFYNEEVRWGYPSKAIKYFNLEAAVACELLEDYDLDFYDLYNMMFKLDKGVDYIKNNYPDFVEALKEDDVKFDSSVIERLKDLKNDFKERAEEAIDDLEGFPGSEIKVVEPEENYTNIKANNFEIYRATIDYTDTESIDEELDFWTIKIDGKYYLVTID